MAPAPSTGEFYKRLLDLGAKDELEPLLEDALALIAEVTGAALAYLELSGDDSSEPRFWRGRGLSALDVQSIRQSISRGIIGRAISEGKTVETPSATDDARFADLGSVRQHEIRAVLCAPIGVAPPIGVIYLQGRTRTGGFGPDDREHVELFARQLAPLADRLAHKTLPSTDHTREIRERFHCAEIVGRSSALARLLYSASHVAPLDVDVLITGPSGTGKSVLARAIVRNSRRATGPLIEVNCAAIPEALIESELFGAEKGAHSTATKRLAGKVAAAEGGTLFLDEVGELSAPAQAKLLQLLETRTYHPLGQATPQRADVRIISATNADLEGRVGAKQFRGDLYYRLHVVPLEVPGIEARREDIDSLVEHFCAEACRRHKLPPLEMSRRALAACREASWPGHTRQLAHAIEAAVIRASGEKARSVTEHHVFPKADATDALLTLQQATRAFQRRYVLDALEQNDWNVSETARELDLARSHLYNLINDFELKRDPKKGTQ